MEMMSQNQQAARDQRLEQLIQQILRAGTTAVWEIVGRLAPDERIDLATTCWRRTHFFEVGLAIAALCEKEAMIDRLGTVVGSILYEQSRQNFASGGQKKGHAARKITLARMAVLN